MDTPGEHLPSAQGAENQSLAARFAPRIFFSNNEPFLPLVAGYTVFTADAPSPSFRRRIEHAGVPAWSTCIEYAIWWDWDIGHLYELEHVWSYVSAGGDLVWAEGSMHGWYNGLELESGAFAHDGDHPVAYAQPGKHAFAPALAWFEEVWDGVIEDCGANAGEGGILVKEAYRHLIAKTEADDAMVTDYLKRLAFVPAPHFERRIDIGQDMLVPWPVLDAWIPRRVNWWIEHLRQESR